MASKPYRVCVEFDFKSNEIANMICSKTRKLETIYKQTHKNSHPPPNPVVPTTPRPAIGDGVHTLTRGFLERLHGERNGPVVPRTRRPAPGRLA